MRIFLGSFHPHLEEAFASEVQKFKSSDPLRPLLILVPSDLIRRRLLILLTLEHGLPLIHFSILTFHQLAMKLCEEQTPQVDFSIKNDLFFEEVLRLEIQKLSGSHPLLSRLEETEGASTVLWQCLRDLKDGLVDGEVLLSALKEGCFGSGAGKKLAILFQLYRQIQKRCKEKALLSFGDLAIRARQALPGSMFLNRFDGIFYYGFYDLTQVQIDLFHAVTRCYDTSLFFPLVRKKTEWDFSNCFYERYVEGLVSSASQVCDLSLEKSQCLNSASEAGTEVSSDSDRKNAFPGKTMINCYDIRDEVLVTAKEILRLVSDEGVQFHEIAVIARDPEPYLSHILKLFQKHEIPITSNCQEPLLQYPFALYALLFMRLRLQDFPRSQCVDLLSSPYFETASFCDDRSAPDKALWDRLTREAGVDKGHASWQRLSKSESPKSSSPKEAVLLLKIFNALHDDLFSLPLKASYSDYVSCFQSLLKKYLGLVPSEESGADPAQEDQVKKGVADILDSLAGLDCMETEISLLDFITTFERWLHRATIPVGARHVAGVSVLGAMSARGLPFRFIFLLGLNEGIFPGSIREDPFLPDRHRHVLETVLGYKVGEKRAVHDEERLLLTLITEAAREGLFVLYHRVSEEAGTASPSGYLNLITGPPAPGERTLQSQSDWTERKIPKNLLERQKHLPFNRFDLLLASEAAFLCALSRGHLEPFLKSRPFSYELYQHGRNALRQLESKGTLTPFDGMCGRLPEVMNAIEKEGVTPTRLENYARCPFRFFASKILKLRSLEAPEDQVDLPMSDAGQLCHEILKAFYARLNRSGFFEDVQTGFPHQVFSEVCTGCFQVFEKDRAMGYPLVWEALKQELSVLLKQVITLDLHELFQSGYRPVAFEVSCRGALEVKWPEMWGRLDRIDFNEADGVVRVVDYKFTRRKQPKPHEKNLVVSAIRGERLQAPIYQKLAEVYGDEGDTGKEQSGSGTRSAFYFLAPNWPDGPLVVREFPEKGWEDEAGILLRESISMLLEGIAQGRFFMMPGEACTYCEIASACRKNHLPSRRRLEQDDDGVAHKMLRKKNLPRKSGQSIQGD